MVLYSISICAQNCYCLFKTWCHGQKWDQGFTGIPLISQNYPSRALLAFAFPCHSCWESWHRAGGGSPMCSFVVATVATQETAFHNQKVFQSEICNICQQCKARACSGPGHCMLVRRVCFLPSSVKGPEVSAPTPVESCGWQEEVKGGGSDPCW